VNVWAAIRGDGKVIFKILDGKQDGKKYIKMLEEKFVEMDMENSFLHQDGAKHHWSAYATSWINDNWKDRWIGLKSPRLSWPPLSMDLTPMDFSFWNYMKRKVAALEPTTTEELETSINLAMNSIDINKIINMCKGVKRRCQLCIKQNGGRFEVGDEE